ncbi:DNA-processing protein DprA [Kineosporia sp. NBRC 101731]|uniref:DNA-processing protein DprA n=1 Tax=Kineosporia sp. NBRC 101731 TaxID=3032199 RepID=UPI002553777D|nr:DNA-processing protein DprA [Kineosporia sp. NBRC 101731]
MAWDDEERAALVALLQSRPDGLSWEQITDRVAELGSARELWSHLVPADLLDQTGDGDPRLIEARAQVRSWQDAPFAFLTFMNDFYPAQLRDVQQMPPFVFAAGRVLEDDRGVCVVGSRRATDHGLNMAAEVSQGLVERSLTVVSGLARGIDGAAHRAALDAHGRTVAVIGTGIERNYPPEHAELQARITSEGLVLSQFWPSSPPGKQTFPLRNAVMSAYGLASVVIEAGETSGARIQARVAVEHGRPVVLFKSVVESTSWAPSLVGAPGVCVVRSADEALTAIDKFLEADAEIDRWLSSAGEPW